MFINSISFIYLEKEEMKKVVFEAIATLVGTIIGAGVLAIPYAFMKAGFLTGLLNLIILSAAVVFLYLYMGEIVLRTKGKMQLTGYAQKYLGKNGRRLMAFTMIFGIYGAIVAYIIGVGRSLNSLFHLPAIDAFGIFISPDLLSSIIFFAFGITVVYFGLEWIKKSELVMSTIVISIILLITIISILGINLSNLFYFNMPSIFIPYGVVLFALAGAVAIPEMEEELVKHRDKLKKAIFIGTLIPIALYLIFALVVVGNCGIKTGEIATTCLIDKYGILMMILGNLFPIFAMSTSFLTLGLGLKQMFNYDYKFSHLISWLYTALVPLILFFWIFFFVKSEIFYNTIGLTGGIAMTLEGILIVLMFNKAKKKGDRKPEYQIKSSKIISAILIILFLIGMIYTILEFLGIIRF